MNGSSFQMTWPSDIASFAMSPFPRCLSKYLIETAAVHLAGSRPSMSVDDGYICAPGSGAAGVAFRCKVRPSAVIMRRRRFSLTVHSGCSESRSACNFVTPSVGCCVLSERTVDLRASSGGEIGVVVDIRSKMAHRSVFPSHQITLPDLAALFQNNKINI
jgi:hypothetical protein